MGRKLTFRDICNSAAAVRCRQAGQSHAQIAKSAGKPASTIRRWISKAGFKQRGGKLRHTSEAIVDKLLEAAITPDDSVLDAAVDLIYKAAELCQTRKMDAKVAAESVRPDLRKLGIVIYPLQPTVIAMSATSKGGATLAYFNTNMLAKLRSSDRPYLRSMLGHELIHVKQAERSGKRNTPAYSAPGGDPEAYYGDQSEIMSFAYTVASDMVTKYGAEETLRRLQRPRTSREMDLHYGNYRYLFKSNNPAIWKKFNRYLYAYAQQFANKGTQDG